MRKFHSNNRLNGILWMISAIGKDRSDENENNLLNIIMNSSVDYKWRKNIE